MAMHRFFNPMVFGTELIYTIIVVVLFFLVYFKTRDIYNLTKYKGIKYFRYAFLFFGFAYLARFLVHIFQLYTIAFDFIIPRRMFFPVSMIPVGYFSTMAIFYLTYSTVWKKIDYNHFMVLSNVVAVSVSVMVFFTRSPILMSLVQFLLLFFTLVYISGKRKKTKKKNIKVLYLLISLFWLVNIFVLSPRRFMPFEFKIVFQIVSLFVFAAIYYKVHKWIR